jgi:hypothetical protein
LCYNNHSLLVAWSPLQADFKVYRVSLNSSTTAAPVSIEHRYSGSSAFYHIRATRYPAATIAVQSSVLHFLQRSVQYCAQSRECINQRQLFKSLRARFKSCMGYGIFKQSHIQCIILQFIGCTPIYCNLWFCGRFVFADGCWAIFYLFPHTKKMGVAVQIEVQTLQPFVVSLTVLLSNTPPSQSNNLNSSAIRHSCYFFKCQHFSDCCGVRTTLPYSLFHQNPTKCCQSILPKATFLQTSN